MMPFPIAHWGGGAFAASPSFYAPLTNTLSPTTALGGSGLTFGRASAAYVQDWENLLKLCKSGEARFTGARRVGNLIAGNSENLTNGSWLKANGGAGSVLAAATANYDTDPLGGATASRLQMTMGTDASAGYSQAYQNYTQPAGVTLYRFSVWIKSNSGTPTIAIALDGTTNVVVTNITLTTSWVRYTTPVLTTTAAATDIYSIIAVEGTLYGGSGNTQTAVDLSVWGAQLEMISGQSNQNPSEYVSVGVLSTPYHGTNVDGAKCFSTLNGNTVASSVITEATGAAITSANGSAVTTDTGGPLGLLIEEARAALLANSEDINAYNVLRATVTANNEFGPNGLKTADTFNEDGSANSHIAWWYNLGGKPAGVFDCTASVYAKKSGRDWLVIIVQDNVASYCEVWFNLNTGTVGTHNVGGTFVFVNKSIQAASNGFYRCIVTVTATAGTTIGTAFATAPSDGNYTTTGINASALILWGSQIEQGSFTTSFISGFSTRPYDGFTYSTFASNASATAGTAYAETKVLWTTAGADYPLIAFGTATAYPLYSATEAATVIRTNDGTNNVGKTGISSMATAVQKVAASWTGSTLAATGGGAAAATGTFDGNMGSTAIGIGNPTTGSGVVWNGHIRNVKLYTSAASATQLATLTA